MADVYGVGLYGDGLYGLGAARVLNVALASPIQHINTLFANFAHHLHALFASPIQHINAVFSEEAMTTPYTTIDSSATVTDQHGTLIATIPTATLTVTFQDQSSISPAVINTGSGTYTATYVTSGPGALVESWSFTDISGAVARAQRILTISY